jgi:hypothetical protein
MDTCTETTFAPDPALSYRLRDPFAGGSTAALGLLLAGETVYANNPGPLRIELTRRGLGFSTCPMERPTLAFAAFGQGAMFRLVRP